MMIDLHMHSFYSDDGEFAPLELLDQCVEAGIQIMSIADHNCARANIAMRMAAVERGITFISGIEIDCVFEGKNFHVLGYGMDEQIADLEEIEKNIKAQSLKTSLLLLEKTGELGFHVTENEMWEMSKGHYWAETWTGEMFAEILLNRPEYLEHPLLSPYRQGGVRGDNPYVNFYWDFYSPGKPCYVKVNFPPLEQIIKTIHRNHGFAVLAHPAVNLKDQKNIPAGIVEAGIDGIEAFSSYHTPNQANHFLAEAKSYGLFVTAGSDYHGKTKPAVKLGRHGCTFTDGEIQKHLARMIVRSF